jgi:DNA-binding transcriptional LysR family regulator
MSDINESDIRRLDGGLLLVFRELSRLCRTTAVAARLGLSQSAVSHALARLRDLFGDELFLRRPRGLEPTPRALELAPRIEALIEAMGASLRADAGFDPKRSERWFRIAATEYAGEAIAARLAGRLRAAAPKVGFDWRSTRGFRALEGLRRGQIDLALGRFDDLSAGLGAEPLFDDCYCVVARRGHPTIRGAIDAAQWAATGHVFAGSHAFDDLTGPTVGEDAMPSPDRVASFAIVPRWEMALAMVAASDGLATGPRRVALEAAERLGLQVLVPPPGLEAPRPWTVSMARRAGADPGLDWFRGEVRAAAA